MGSWVRGFMGSWVFGSSGAIQSEWGGSENNRKAKFYSITPAGEKRLKVEEEEWQQATEIVGRFFSLGESR